MALLISEDRIACDARVADCPKDAIGQGNPTSIDNPNLSTECVGISAEPQCALLCLLDDTMADPQFKETYEEFVKKYHRLHPD